MLRLAWNGAITLEAEPTPRVRAYVQKYLEGFGAAQRSRQESETDYTKTLREELLSCLDQISDDIAGVSLCLKDFRPLLMEPFSLVSRLTKAQAVYVHGPLDARHVQKLAQLSQLAVLRISEVASADVVRAICRNLQLADLDLGGFQGGNAGFPECPQGGGNAEYVQMLTTLASWDCTALKALTIPCPAGALPFVTRLSALTALTSLHLRTWGNATLEPLLYLTQLRGLCLEVLDWSSETPTIGALWPLTTLTRLEDVSLVTGEMGLVRADERVLSEMSALKGYSCNVSDCFKFRDEDSLPLQLRALGWSTSLRKLDIALRTHHCRNRHARVCTHDETWEALRSAVSRLQLLTEVRFRIKAITLGIACADGMEFYKPLALFTGAPSVQTLHYDVQAEERAGNLAWYKGTSPAVETILEAESCLQGLPELRSIRLGSASFLSMPVPHSSHLLDALPSTQLTALHLRVADITEPLLQSIQRFQSLQELSLLADDFALGPEKVLSMLFRLTSLHKLDILLPCCHALSEADRVLCCGRVSRLEIALLEVAGKRNGGDGPPFIGMMKLECLCNLR